MSLPWSQHSALDKQRNKPWHRLHRPMGLILVLHIQFITSLNEIMYHFSMSFTSQPIKRSICIGETKYPKRNMVRWCHYLTAQTPSPLSVFISTGLLLRWRCTVVIDALTIDVKHNNVSWGRWILPDHWQLHVNSFRSYLPFHTMTAVFHTFTARCQCSCSPVRC